MLSARTRGACVRNDEAVLGLGSRNGELSQKTRRPAVTEAVNDNHE